MSSTTIVPPVSWLANLKDDHRESLTCYGSFVPVQPEEVLIRDGEHMASAVNVILEGQLEVRVPQQGGTYAILGHLGAGEAVGEIALYDPVVAPVTVVVSQPSLLWRLSAEDLDRFILDNPGASSILLISLIRALCQRIRQRN